MMNSLTTMDWIVLWQFLSRSFRRMDVFARPQSRD